MAGDVFDIGPDRANDAGGDGRGKRPESRPTPRPQ
jgi:hypothetical protein